MVGSFSTRRAVFVVGALAALALTPGCESNEPPTTPQTALIPITETFTGTISPNGAATFPFTSGAAGNVTASLDKIDPITTGAGLALGTWNGSSCAILIANDNAVQTSQIVGNATGPAALCVRIYDIGKITGAAAYTVSVIHP